MDHLGRTRPVKSLGSLRRRSWRRLNKTGKRARFVKKWTWDPEYQPLPQLTKNMSQEMFLGLSDLADHITSKIISKRTQDGQPTFVEEFNILASRDQWFKYIRRFYDDHQVVQMTDRSGIMINNTKNTYTKYEVHSSTITLTIVGDATYKGLVGEAVREKFEEVITELEWVYGTDGASIDIPLRADRHPVKEMYPFLNKDETLEEYYDRFMESSASILLLIGPPGTGKTSFIRGLMQHTQSSAVVSYDENILSKDYVFAQFIEGDQNMMVVEDADMFLKARSEGNTTMHKFLNIGDGLVTTRNKKLIFSTNLPSIREIDPALIRPGRCFDVLTFDYLTQQQAQALADKVGVVLTGEREQWTIADVFFQQSTTPERALYKNKLGFV